MSKLNLCAVFLRLRELPDDVLNILESAFETAVNSEEYADYCHDNMAEPLFMNSEEYTAYCAEELELYSQLVVDAGLSA